MPEVKYDVHQLVVTVVKNPDYQKRPHRGPHDTNDRFTARAQFGTAELTGLAAYGGGSTKAIAASRAVRSLLEGKR